MYKEFYVFFDVDGTLVNIKTMRSFLKFYYAKKCKTISFINNKLFDSLTYCFEKLGVSREFLNKQYYKKYRGVAESKLYQLGLEWFIEEKNRKKNFYCFQAIKKLKEHQAAGAQIVFVSGSFGPCLAPLADELGVKHIIATKLEIIDDIYTGKIVSPQTIGKGKAEAILQFLNNKKFFDTKKCFAYGDHVSDIPMLNVVGNPCVIAGDDKLESYAKKLGWPILTATVVA